MIRGKKRRRLILREPRDLVPCPRRSERNSVNIPLLALSRFCVTLHHANNAFIRVRMLVIRQQTTTTTASRRKMSDLILRSNLLFDICTQVLTNAYYPRTRMFYNLTSL